MRAIEFIGEGIWDKMKSAIGGKKPQEPQTDPRNINNRIVYPKDDAADSYLANSKTKRWLSDYDHVTKYNGLDIGIGIQDKLVSVDAYTPEGMRVGLVQFSRNGKNLISNQLRTDDEWRGKGIAKAMYDFAKTQGFNVMASSNQTADGKAFWKKNRGKETVWEDEVDEMALPADWDPAAFGHDKTFKSRLEYAKDRAQRLGGGSSRVAFVIPDNGRETVLKIAKNKKGMAQNEAEIEVLDDGYLGKLDIVIPLVDYDKQNPTPTWIQTEKANKVSQQKLAKMLHAGGRWPMTNFLYAVDNLLGRKQKYMPTLDQIKQEMLDTGSNEQDIDIFLDYVNQVADLVNSSNLLSGDFGTASNWGEYQGRPVIIDLGYTSAVHDLYWGR